MKNINKILLTALVVVSMGAVSANATVAKGQKLYLKKLKSACGMNGAEMAEKHTVSEWEHLNEKGEIAKEIKKFCPKAKDSSLKENYIPHYFDFFKEYGSDSGNVPSC